MSIIVLVNILTNIELMVHAKAGCGKVVIC